MDDYNLIIELEVDIQTEKSTAELGKILLDMQLKWSKVKADSLVPAIKTRAATNLNNMNLYKEILADAGKIKAQYAAAREIISKKKKAAENDLEKAIDFFWKGTASAADIDALITRFIAQGFTEKELRAKIASQKPSSGSGGSQTKLDLDIRSFEKLHKHLEAVNSSNLFDFLELPLKSNPSRAKLLEASSTAQSLYRSRGTGDVKNVEGKEIASLGMKIFATEVLCQKYLLWLQELPLKTELDKKMTGLKELSISQYLALLQDTAKALEISMQLTRDALDRYITNNRITAKFAIDDPGAQIRCFCSKSAKLIDYTCPDGHVLFYKCSNCGVSLPRNKTVCVCGYDLSPFIQRIKSAQASGDWDTLGKLIAEDKVLDMDYFSTMEYSTIFERLQAGIQKDRADKEKLDQQYRQFCDCVNRGDLNSAFSLWRQDFDSFSGVAEMKQKLSTFRPGKITVRALRNRGNLKILELDVPLGITHIGVKYSGSSDAIEYSVDEIKNMLEVTSSCAGVTIYGIIRYANKELRGDVTIKMFENSAAKQTIPFSLTWTCPMFFLGKKCLNVMIKNSSTCILNIPKTVVVGIYSLTTPIRKDCGEVLLEFGPKTVHPDDSVIWELPLDSVNGNISVNLFSKDDPNVCFEPVPGTKMRCRF
ncbi:MAG: hypothetical protein RBS43_04330 [Candidatus Cloacimonas sp.]|jgi:hypothetical protein|nr:hypothetical protein [Candidatus Cloacimonas sp.]